ncbi:NlpC/P60 family protein [Paenibacillus bouchesdurhonensis]|uniref:NlpC/P60 family protein n=1 Tax=Paenibacillus bouchesdurhonensis TaxID=1870990 RepID=UPI001F225445|nr:NlpC/P60 family protein [Paenibacillus bouchesdurhonensis]
MSESNSLNSLTTIYSRLTTLRESEQVLNSIGISMKDMNGNVKNGSVVLDEVAGKWSNLSKEQQYNTALQLAGQSQLSRFIGLMENYDISTRASETALNSQGSAMRENAEHMNSLEARMQTMRTAWDTLALSMGNAVINDSIIGVTSILTGLMKVLTSCVDTFGLLPTLLGIVGTSAATVSKNFRTTTIAVLTLGKGMTSLGVSARAAGIAIKGLLASTGVGLALAALGFVLEKVINLFGSAQESQEEYFENLKQNIADTENNIVSLENLSKTLSDRSKSQEELNKALEQTSQSVPDIISHYTTEGKAVYKTKAEIDKLIESEKALNLERSKRLYQESAESLKGPAKEIASNQKKVEKLQQRHDYASTKVEALLSAEEFINNNRKVLDELDTNSKEYIEIVQELNDKVASIFRKKGQYVDEGWLSKEIFGHGGITQAVTASRSELGKLDGQFQDAESIYESGLKNFTDLFKTYNNNLINETNVTDNNVRLFLDNLSNSFSKTMNVTKSNSDELVFQYEDLASDINQYLTDNKIDLAQAIESGDTAAIIEDLKLKFPDYINVLDDLAISLAETSKNGKAGLPVYDETGREIGRIASAADEAASSFHGLKEVLGENNEVIGFTGYLTNTEGTIGYLSKYLQNAREEMKLLNDAEKELEEGQSLSISTIKMLNDKYGDFADVTKLGREEILLFLQAKKKQQIESITADIKETQTLINNANERIKKIKEERQALIETYAAKVANGTMTDLQAEKLSFGKTSAIQNSLESELEDETLKLKLYQVALDELTKTQKLNEKETKNSKETLKETTEILSRLQQQINAVDDAIKKVNNQRERYAKHSQKYRDSIIAENKLLAEKNRLLEEGVKDPSKLLPVKQEVNSSGTSSSSSNPIHNMLSAASSLQGTFTYKQVPGKFKGTYEEFTKQAVSDCSQFVQEMFDEFLGINLPRTAAEQAKQGTKIDKADLQRGDLVFFNTTGKDNSHVGIYMGNGEFIQMGVNSGLSTQKLDSKYWSEKYQGAKRVTNSSYSSSTPISGDHAQKDLDEAGKQAAQEIVENNAKIYQGQRDYLESVRAYYANLLDIEDDNIHKSQFNQSNYSDHSEVWRKYEADVVGNLIKKRDIKKKEYQEFQNTIDAKGFEPELFEADLRKLLQEIDDITLEINGKNLGIINSKLDEFSEKASGVNQELELSKARMAQVNEISAEYSKELSAQISLTSQQIDINEEAIKYLEQQLRSEQLSAKAKEELTKELHSLIIANHEYNRSIQDIRETYADQIITNFKKMIETKRDLELDALEERTKAENKRHEKFMQNIDEEDKRFEEYINKQIKLLDRQNTSDDYESELEKKLKERQKIQENLNKWSLDQSMEGKAKRKELQEQLDAADEEIERYKLERERTLTKEGLQDQLDDRKKYTEKVKKDQDDLHKDTLEKIDSEKEKTQQKYKDILENEKYFYEIKKNLLSQDAQVVEATLAELKGKYDTFFSILKNHAFDTSQAFENLNYAMQMDYEKLLNFPLANNSSNNAGSNNSSVSPSFTDKEKEIIRIMEGNSKAWAAATNQNRRNEIAAENLRLGAQIGATRDDKTGIWYKNDVQLYHDGGEVGVAGTTTQTWWEKIKSTLKPNEELGILKTGEVVLDNPLQFVYNFAGEMSKKLSLLSPSSSTANAVPAVSGGGVAIDTVIIQANDRETGTSLLNKFESAMNRSIKKGTFKK